MQDKYTYIFLRSFSMHNMIHYNDIYIRRKLTYKISNKTFTNIYTHTYNQIKYHEVMYVCVYAFMCVYVFEEQSNSAFVSSYICHTYV